jgi:hypothetical protein
MRPRWNPGSSPLRSTPGRTRTCDRPDVNRVPSPLGHGSKKAPGESSSPGSRPGWIRTSVLHHVRVASTPLLHETRKSVRRESHPCIRLGGSVPGLLGHGHKQGRKDLNPLRAGWSRTTLPGARPCRSDCPGRTRTCTPPVNSGLHDRRAARQDKSGRQDLNLRSPVSETGDHSSWSTS